MAYIQDSSQSFTISLTALLEGLGLIDYIILENLTDLSVYEWYSGIWQTPLPEAVEGDSITISVGVLNDGAVTDDLFAEFVSAQITPNEALIQEALDILVGGVADPLGIWSFTMPATNVNITINAGHVE